jgi:hypothetical protein
MRLVFLSVEGTYVDPSIHKFHRDMLQEKFQRTTHTPVQEATP